MGWINRNGTVCYEEHDGSLYVPPASEIYKLVTGGEVQDHRYRKFRDDLSNMRFSKIALAPQLKLSLENGNIVGTIWVTKRGSEYSVEFTSLGGSDHVVIDNNWHYISHDYHLAEELLEKSDVVDPRNITFSSYIKILDLKREYASLKIVDLVIDNLKSSDAELIAPIPNDLKANLYTYQSVGFRWLKYITDEGFGCILGDEMGLGKTMQIITLFLDRKEKKQGPDLVIAPVSLLENWKREIEKFAPDLSIIVHHGSKRTGRFTDLTGYDVVITAYSTISNDLSMLEMISWDLVVLDEAQNIKTPTANRTISVKQLPRRAGVAVTGTPFENHIVDLWSLLDFAIPGCLGTRKQFDNQYPDDIEGAEKIEPFLSAMMIRRKVADVAQDLPEKVLIAQPLSMSDVEAIKYEDMRQSILATCSKQSATLATLTKLRMYCTHPFLVEEVMPDKDPAKVSTKYVRLCEILDEIIDNGEKTILFTSYTRMFDILQKDIPLRFGIPVMKINGETPVEERQEIIDDFSSKEGAALLVLNPKAAGVGLNITAANHVIHYNLEWNPALEDQATARAFRRGQEKTVFVHRLFFVDTVEQVVDEKINHKRIMSDTAVVGSTGEADNREMIIKALDISPVNKEI